MAMKMAPFLMLAVCTLVACEQKAADRGEASKNEVKGTKEAPAKQADQAPAYVCPAPGDLTVDWAPGADDTFALALKLPEGFVHQTPEGPGQADFKKTVTLPSSKERPPYNQRDYRISFTQMALTTDIRDKAEYKPYKMGTGFGEDGNRDEQMNLFVGGRRGEVSCLGSMT